jgi:AcrR family transcriptional regulator
VAELSVKERRAREKEELRQEILDAARELFAKEGYENVSMRKIARKIDYSATTIYLYFKDKDELFGSICEETFTKLVKRFEDIVASADDPLEQLRRAGRAYIEFGLSHPNHYKVTFMGCGQPGHIEDEKLDFHGSIGEKCFLHLRTIVENCVRQGKIRPVDVDATSQALWAAAHGITSLLISDPHFPWVSKERLIEHVVDVMTKGLRG